MFPQEVAAPFESGRALCESATALHCRVAHLLRDPAPGQELRPVLSALVEDWARGVVDDVVVVVDHLLPSGEVETVRLYELFRDCDFGPSELGYMLFGIGCTAFQLPVELTTMAISLARPLVELGKLLAKAWADAVEVQPGGERQFCPVRPGSESTSDLAWIQDAIATDADDEYE
jgi:hypothetical protein